MSSRYILRRLLYLVPVVLCIAAMNFVLLHMAPGDAAEIIAGQSGHGSQEAVAQLRKEFGLDRPLYQQFFYFVYRLLTLDLGYSYVQSTPVATLIWDRLPATLLLMVTSLTMAVGGGVLLGVAAARARGDTTNWRPRPRPRSSRRPAENFAKNRRRSTAVTVR